MKILAKLIFEFLRLIFRSKQDIVLENLALRQQLAVQQLRETFAFDEATKYVIRDNDKILPKSPPKFLVSSFNNSCILFKIPPYIFLPSNGRNIFRYENFKLIYQKYIYWKAIFTYKLDGHPLEIQIKNNRSASRCRVMVRIPEKLDFMMMRMV